MRTLLTAPFLLSEALNAARQIAERGNLPEARKVLEDLPTV